MTSRQTAARRNLLACVRLVAFLLLRTSAHAQDLGHKIPGGVGVDAGAQGPAGLYVADRLFYYAAERLVDCTGAPLPVEGFELDAVGNGLGVLGTLELPNGTHLSATVALPIAHIAASSDDPRSSIDRFGLGDLYVMPLKAGWRLPHVDVVASYGLYIPTGEFEAGGGTGVGRGFWAHQFSAGGAVFFDDQRRARASILAGYDLNQKKRGVDITRGDTVQLQGGVGVLLWRFVDVGVAGYALWQVTDDRGADVPALLRGARDQVYGLGPEVSVLIPALRTKVGVRHEWDLSAQSRPEGHLWVFSVAVLAWRPAPPEAPRPAR